jgi:hypothetical protein
MVTKFIFAFRMVLKKPAVLSLNSITWMTFVVETKCISCRVRTEILYFIFEHNWFSQVRHWRYYKLHTHIRRDLCARSLLSIACRQMPREPQANWRSFVHWYDGSSQCCAIQRNRSLLCVCGSCEIQFRTMSFYLWFLCENRLVNIVQEKIFL